MKHFCSCLVISILILLLQSCAISYEKLKFNIYNTNPQLHFDNDFTIVTDSTFLDTGIGPPPCQANTISDFAMGMLMKERVHGNQLTIDQIKFHNIALKNFKKLDPLTYDHLTLDSLDNKFPYLDSYSLFGLKPPPCCHKINVTHWDPDAATKIINDYLDYKLIDAKIEGPNGATIKGLYNKKNGVITFDDMASNNIPYGDYQFQITYEERLTKKPFTVTRNFKIGQ